MHPPGLPRPREFRSAAEMRSRSHTRNDHASRSMSAAGQPPTQPNADTMQTFQQMMARQLLLLEEQNAMLRQQMIDTTCSQQSFQSPEKVLDSLDPTLRDVMQRWKTSFKKDLAHLATQTELQEKYQKIVEDNAIMKQFQQEATRQWQWPHEYASVARPVLGIDADEAADSQYDLNAAWESLRKKHALECQSFIIEHQKRALQFFERKVDAARVKQHVNDLFEDWKGKYGNFLTVEAALQTQNMCKSYMHSVIRSEIPKMKGRLSESAELRKKQASALLDAETKFQSMDPQMLIALIELDKHAVQSSKADNAKAKRVDVPKSSQLAALVKKFPDLNNHFEIKLTDSKAQKPSNAQRRQPTPHPNGRRVSRSSSKRSSENSAGRSNVVRRSTSRSSARSTSLQSSRASSKRSSRASSKSNQPRKGKGKGKSKGHSRAKGKGRGNSQGAPPSIMKKNVSFQGRRRS